MVCTHWVIIIKNVFLPPATKLGQGNIFRSVCQQFCPQGGMHGCWRVCVVLFGGLCMVLFGGHVWFYLGGVHGFIQGGMHGFMWGGMCGFIWGVCMVLFGGHAWFYSGGHVWFFQFFWIQWDTVNERAVCILLECILVFQKSSWSNGSNWTKWKL